MEEFNAKYADIIKRGYEISFSEKENFNQFTKIQEKIYYASFKKNGKEIFYIPSRDSTEKALLDGYYLLPKVEKLLKRYK